MFVKARVSTGLLKKADRLFTGTDDGRIIELVQNSRRANARNIWITQDPLQEGQDRSRIVFQDDGEGIKDFAELLDLGGLHWGDEIVEAEDPGGIGLFSLAPGQVEILSHGHRMVIEGEGWWGAPVEVIETHLAPEVGTTLIFEDEGWGSPAWNNSIRFNNELLQHGKFSGVKIHYNNGLLAQESFLIPSPRCKEFLPTHYPELGVHIQVIPIRLTRRDQDLSRSYYREYTIDTSMNFYGHVLRVPENHWSFRDSEDVYHQGYNYTIRVDMTGEPTPIRLMLPARTQFVENDALKDLQQAIKKEVYRYFQRLGSHHIPYEYWLESKRLGIELPEAEQTYSIGVDHHDSSRGDTEAEHLSYDIPDLNKAIRCTKKTRLKLFIDGEEQYNLVCENHDFQHSQIYNTLLCDKFPVVRISDAYRGYSWFDLPGNITSVRIDLKGCLDSTTAGGDGLTLSVYEEMKVTLSWTHRGIKKKGTADFDSCWDDDDMNTRFAVSKDALLHRRGHQHLWYLSGGHNDNSEDSYSKQSDDFDEEVQSLRDRFVSPYETLRRNCVEKIEDVCGRRSYRSITIENNGNVHITYSDGHELFMTPQGTAEENGGEECLS